MAPFRGLVPYSENDAHLFFGRDNEREVIITNLLASRLTLLYGASGVGKTSVLRAGVAYNLNERSEANRADSGNPGHAVVVFSAWRTDPVAGLLAEVTRTLERGLRLQDASSLLDATDGRRLSDTLSALTTRLDLDLLLVLDQFEDYFFYHPEPDESGSLVRELPLVVHRPGLRVNTLISLREDTLARLDRFKGRIPTLFDNYLRIDQLDRAAARAAIELPLKEYNKRRRGTAEGPPLSAEPELVEAVLNELAADVGGAQEIGRGTPRATNGKARIDPSYLQIVMTRVWKEEQRLQSPVLRLSTLRQLGSAQDIERSYLDETMASLSTEQQDVAAAIFNYLVTPSGVKIAHTVDDLAKYAEISDASVDDVVRILAGDVRILRSFTASLEGERPRFEIYHDRLADPVLGWRTRYLAHAQRMREQRIAEERIAAAQQQLLNESSYTPEARADTSWPTFARLSILVLIGVCVVLNVIVGQLVRNVLKLPPFLDSIGTILAGALGGPLVGAATGALSNLVAGVLFRDPGLIPYALTGASIGLCAGVAASLGAFKRLPATLLAGVITGAIAALVSAPISAYVEWAAAGPGAVALLDMLASTGDNVFQAVTLEEFTSEPLDKALSFLVVFGILRLLPRSIHQRFSEASHLERSTHPTSRYGVAILLSLLAFVFVWVFRPAFGTDVYAIFYLAVVLSSWYGGIGPGILAVCAGIMTTLVPQMPPFGPGLGIDDWLRVMLFIVVAFLVALITDRLDRSNRALTSALAETRTVVAGVVEGLVLVSPDDHRVLRVNHQFETLFGVSRSQILGRTLDELRGFFEQFFAEPDVLRQRIAEVGNDQTATFTQTLRQVWPQERLLELFSAPVLSERAFLGRFYGFRELTQKGDVDPNESRRIELSVPSNNS
jgi:PAS domain-containing protein